MSEKKKVAALTMRRQSHQYPSSLEWRDSIAQDWYPYLESFNFQVRLVPNLGEGAISILEGADVLFLSGGDDILPDEAVFGDAQKRARDRTERILFEHAVRVNMPVIGVCRGMQLINLILEGTLVESSPGHPCPAEHAVMFDSESFLTKGLQDPVVNSFHNKSIGVLAETLVPFARSEDGIVEGVIARDMPVMGMMWHPERLERGQGASRISDQLVQRFLEAKGKPA